MNPDRFRTWRSHLGGSTGWQHPYRLWYEVLLASYCKNIGRIERSVTTSVIHDIAPDLQHPESTYEGFVDRTTRHLCQVVHVAPEGSPPVTGEFLGARFRFGDQSRVSRLVVIVDRRHLEHVIRTYVTNYDTARPHRGLKVGTPIAHPPQEAGEHGSLRRK